MKLLVSFCNITPGAPLLGLLDIDSFEFEVSAPPMPSGWSRCSGITGLAASDEYLFALVQEADSLRLEGRQSPPCLMVYGMEDLALVEHYVFRNAADIHSLQLSGSDFYAVSTGTDEIVRLTFDGPRVTSESVFWRADGSSNREDRNHLNSICFFDQELVVSGFGPKADSQWSSARDGFIARTTDSERIARGLLQPHSLLELDGALLYCESATRAIRVLGDHRCQYLPGYTRGLCAIDRRIFVATSVGRRVSRSTGLINNPFDPGEAEGQCTITCVSADTLAIERSVDLQAYAREIYDLLPVSGTRQWPTISEVEWRDRAIQQLQTAYEKRTDWALDASNTVAQRDERLKSATEQLHQVTVKAGSLEACLATSNSERLELTTQVNGLLTRTSQLELRLESFYQRLLRANEELQTQFKSIRSDFAATCSKSSDDWKLQYARSVRNVREIVNCLLPAGATVLVVSKGDDALVQFEDRKGWHFPQDPSGNYTGFTPADSGSAIVQLEALRMKGADYLVFPPAALWWLENYAGLREHLERRYRVMLRRDDIGIIYGLRADPGKRESSVWTAFENFLGNLERRLARDPAVLDWCTGLYLANKSSRRTIFSPPGNARPDCLPLLPYLDGTVDVVAVASTEQAVISEAKRVAEVAVIVFDPSAGQGCNTAALTFDVLWLSEPEAKPLPSASIIIPSYNGIALTAACLQAIKETLPPDFRGEIVVVDDASTDDTPQQMQFLAEQDHRIASVRNPQNLGFVGTCNRGAELAKGDVLVFLNNDTLPQPGWLETLLRTFEEHPDAGAVGGKLVYPDGRLQEAGGLIFSDGSAANFGRGAYEIDAPLYNYVREVDYVTGALIATSRALFEKLGGLDLRYRPIYYEETDYCFRVREAGLKVYYQPASIVIHLEGATCGTDPSGGQKRYQLVNREKFIERWRHVLSRQPQNPHHFDVATWYGLAVREEFGSQEPSCDRGNGDRSHKGNGRGVR